MKKAYIFLLIFCISFFSTNAQSDCSTAYAHIVYALSHSESALDANNVTHAKHFAVRAKEAFQRVQASLKDCQCEEVDDLVYDAIDYLAKAKTTEKLEDAYYFANKGKKLAEASIEKLDYCTVGSEDLVEVAPVSTEEPDNAMGELLSIAQQQEQLEQQQRALEGKQAELRQQLAQKKAQELDLKKEELILKLETTLATNIKTFNKALQDCNCNTEIENSTLNTKALSSKSLEEIRWAYIDAIEQLSSNYTIKLADCKNK